MILRSLFLLLLALGPHTLANAWEWKNILPGQHAPGKHGHGVPMSIVNTTDNTRYVNGAWQSDMGPLTTQQGGLACDNTVEDMRFHAGEYMYWHIAPSDSMSSLGMVACSPNEQGEPSCSENWHLCGRKVRVKCVDPEYCSKPGQPSLASVIRKRNAVQNNYIPGFFVDELTQLYGRNPKPAESVVLYITDFCPSQHSSNRANKQCQGPQVDISTFAYLLMGKPNEYGYINSNMRVAVELLPPGDPTPVGPEGAASNIRRAGLE